MEYHQILEQGPRFDRRGQSGPLSTIGEGGYPHTRWMTPATLPRLKGMVYAVTARGFPKAAEIEADPRVQWLLQAPDFSEVATLTGKARLVDDPVLLRRGAQGDRPPPRDVLAPQQGPVLPAGDRDRGRVGLDLLPACAPSVSPRARDSEEAAHG